MSILHLTPTFADIKTWVRAATTAVYQLITGKQDQSDNLDSIAGLTLTGNAGDAIVVKATEDGFELVAGGGGGGGTTTNALTINNSGSGAASGATFNGSAAVTISYNTVGAAASSHTHAQSDVTNLVTDLAAKQPLDADLTAIAALTTTAYGRALLELANAAALRTAGGLVIGTDVLGMGGGILTGDLSVPDEAYDATNWNGSTEAPTKNAVRDKIESLPSPAMALISEQSPAGGATSVTFASIPATYRDLTLVFRGRGDTAATSANVQINFNNDTASNYDRIRSGGSNTTSSTAVANEAFALIGSVPAASATASVPGYCEAAIADYRSTTFHKTWQGTYGGRNGTTNTGLTANMVHGRWASTAAITEIDVVLSAGGFAAGTIISLYGRM